MSQPVFSKSPNRPDHNREITWSLFLKLIQWANETAKDIGYPVYLVGSSLYKDIPRDVDIAIIMPLLVYETKFGTLPKEQKDYAKYLHNVWEKTIKYYFTCEEAIDRKLVIDFKVCPDTWFTDRPKLLLSQPNVIFKI